jgi:hypothetical protein
MLLLDFSQVMIANLHVQIGLHAANEVEPDLLKHMVLNTLRSIRTRFPKDEYGELIIACDGRSWRKNIFPYYKAARATAKEKSHLDWNAIFKIFNEIRDDVAKFFPYRVVGGEGAEADDVIGTLVQEFGVEGLNTGETIVILSGDKDFAQLHRYANVKQYNPVAKAWITHHSANEYLQEHIIKGDAGDGVPNILSDDDTFVVPGKRQKPMTAKRMKECKEMFYIDNLDSIADPEITRRYIRNFQLIDLRNTPDEVRKSIMESYEQQAGKTKRHIFNYLMKNRMRILMESISDF